MNRTRWIIGIGAAAALAGGGTAVALASGGDDGADKPITGKTLDRASAEALQHTGGGRVTDSEVGDEEGYYEVEVTRPDGSSIDVHLDRDFKVIGSHADTEDARGQDAIGG
jgi:uncharacterized membrane protein YkoI